jgi:CRISPR-associated protein Cas8a1/Csx13
MALEMELKLNAAGMTSLHKAGLAGLYMTLCAFERKREKIDGLEWTLESQRVILRWTHDTPKAAFVRLIKKSFWIDREGSNQGGFIRLAGLEAYKEPSKEQKYHLSDALLHSFLQHGQHRKVDKKRPLPYTEEMGGRLCWIKEFTLVQSVKPYEEAVMAFINAKGYFNESVKVAGWLYPGGGQRHGGSSIFNEPVKTGLALMYAPVGVIFYKLRSRTKGRKARFAMVIPEIRHLESYAKFRRVPAHRSLEMTANSASDAALRFITHLAGHDTRKDLIQVSGNKVHCRVITFGIVKWAEQQKTRTFAYSVFSEKLKGLENYKRASEIFPNSWQISKEEKNRRGIVTKPESNFVSIFTAREFISDNIAQGNEWYDDLATFLNNREARKGLSFEWKELNQMVQKAQFEKFEGDAERLFVNVCQTSWRRRMGKLSEGMSGRGEYRADRVQREFEKLRVAISRTRNAHTLRKTVVDLWARAGRLEELQGGRLQKLLPLFDEDWRRARDLALLALISYPKTGEDETPLDTEEQEEETDE